MRVEKSMNYLIYQQEIIEERNRISYNVYVDLSNFIYCFSMVMNEVGRFGMEQDSF